MNELNELICKAWTICCEDYADGGGISKGATEAAEFFVKETEAGGEYTPTPLLVNMFKAFYGGFVQGCAFGKHVAERKLPEARPIPESRRDAVWKRETAAAARLALFTGDARFDDCDCATIVYNANRAAHPGMPFEFHLASVWFAGVERGRERERERLRSEKRRRERQLCLAPKA